MLRSPTENRQKSTSTGDLDKCELRENTRPFPVTTNQPQITLRDKRRRVSDDDYDELTAFKIEIRDMLKSFTQSQNNRLDSIEHQIVDLKSQVTSTSQGVEKSLNVLSEKINILELSIQGFDEQRKDIELKISYVEEKLDNIEKNNKKTSIDIRNVPKTLNENKEVLFSYIQTLSESLKLDLSLLDIKDVYRVPSKVENKYSTIVAEFSNTLTKSKILKAANIYNKSNPTSPLSTSHIGITGDTTRIYPSESLTSKSKRLFFLARSFAKSNDYKYCWTSNGNVLLRKQDGTNCIVVKNEDVLNGLS